MLEVDASGGVTCEVTSTRISNKKQRDICDTEDKPRLNRLHASEGTEGLHRHLNLPTDVLILK